MGRLATFFRRERSSLPLYLTALALIALPYASRLWLLKVRGFNPDELQHLHSAWCFSKGMLPYRDFFEHHTPGLQFFLAPLFSFFDVETKFSDAFSFVLLARRLMWLFAGAILALTFWLGLLWGGRRVAWVGTLLLSNTIMFWRKTLEIRPDLLSVSLLLASLALVVFGLRSEDPFGRRVKWRFAWSGAFLGTGLMCTQKMLFALPGFSLCMLWCLLDRRGRGSFRERLRAIFFQLAGFFLPILLTVSYFLLRNGLEEFTESNLLLNLRWKARIEPYTGLQELVRQNPFVGALALAGFLRAFPRLFGRERFRRGDFVIGLNGLGLFAGLFINPVPHRQYYLMFLPLAAILAASCLVELVDIAPKLGEVGAKWSWVSRVEATLILSSAGTVLYYGLAAARPRVLNAIFYPALWGVVLVAAAALLWIRAREGAIALLLIPLSVYPLQQMSADRNWKNWSTLDGIRYVLENTSPGETVMDGFSGLGVFRPHAYFYFFLHDEIRVMLASEERARLLTDLRSGAIAPKLIFLDRHLRGISREITAHLEQNYLPVGKGEIWALFYRDARWTDEGVRRLGRPPEPTGNPVIPYLLLGDGWHEPQGEGERTFRSSRGRRSWVFLPIGEPVDFRASLRARLEYLGAPVSFELAVNGKPVGQAWLSPGWRDYVFAVPGHLLRRGLNSFVLAYSRTPRQGDARYRGRNAVVAVEYVKLERYRDGVTRGRGSQRQRIDNIS